MSEAHWKEMSEQLEADEAMSIVEHQLYRDAAQGYMTDERVPAAFKKIRNALASRQQCPYVVTSRGGTSHCSLSDQWGAWHVRSRNKLDLALADIERRATKCRKENKHNEAECLETAIGIMLRAGILSHVEIG